MDLEQEIPAAPADPLLSLQELARPVDNPVFEPIEPPKAAKTGSPLQAELDIVSRQCTELSSLCCRLDDVLCAVRGPTPQGNGRDPQGIPNAPKSPSWLDGMRFFNDCHAAVLYHLGQMVGELEQLLAVVPRETSHGNRS